jgi:membrane glycosyltransferase
LGLSVDAIVEPITHQEVHVPADASLDMPIQRFDAWEPGRALDVGPYPRGVILARVFVFATTILLTAFGTYEIYKVISTANVTWLQVIFATLFALTFAWIAFSCASACLGFWQIVTGRQTLPPLAPQSEIGRTALLMPVYNENAKQVAAALEKMGSEIARLGAADHFDIFILSDTRDLRVALEELHAVDWLKKALFPHVRVHYRRRLENKHRKAGNIADFVTRWGGHYDHMIVLDADSTMSGDTLLTLARAMAADPKAGIIQTVPALHHRNTLFARMQQFAGRVYGPVIAAGLAAWHGRDGNYWGHNAIIRTRAFAEAAGLPELEGRKPFGGHVMSHDFVEAALIRRAGWAVYMLPSLGGSYEEAPPTLDDLAGRDRRWCQGNLQHAKIVGAKGLHWASRLHLVHGIMSYLASPLWLLLLATGLGLSAVAQYTAPNYFPEGFSLFPAWPVFDPERALRLFGFTMLILLLPKMLALIHAFANRELRKGCGGVTGLLLSVVAETLLSALLSPVTMLIQSRFVFDIFAGRDSGWNAQNRDDVAQPYRAALVRHMGHSLAGVVLAVVSLMVSWQTFLWLSTIALGLVTSSVVAWATGLVSLGVLARSWNLFRIPEESAPVLGAPVKPEGMTPAPRLEVGLNE